MIKTFTNSIMDIEIQNWDLADKDFNLWLNEKKEENNLPQTEILKSAYLIFRKIQTDRLKELCDLAFSYIKEKEKLLFEVSSFDQSDIRFRKSLLYEPQADYSINIQDTNAEIIRGILAGDQRIVNHLYEVEFPTVVRYIKRNSGNQDIAKDVFQDALLVLIEKVYHHHLELSCPVGNYLFSICRRQWSSHLRKNKRSKTLVDNYIGINDNFSSIGDDNFLDNFELVENAIERMGDRSKQLLECFYYKNMSWDEIARKLGYSNAASARNQKYKCLERIRKSVIIE